VRTIALCLVTACTLPTKTAREPGRWGVEQRQTQTGYYLVDVAFDPPRPAMGELFSAVATVRTRDGQPLDVGKVALDARMPQHNHGMETDPVDWPGECEADGKTCKHPNGLYRADGFKFHMPGAWTVTVDVSGPRGPDSTSFVVEYE
jgi:hypothetical protein